MPDVMVRNCDKAEAAGFLNKNNNRWQTRSIWGDIFKTAVTSSYPVVVVGSAVYGE